MGKATKICRVCGKAYEACHTEKKDPSIFRWQDVACSPECGTEYLRRVTEARNPQPKRVQRVKPHPVKPEPIQSAPAESEVESTATVADSD